MNSFLDLYTSSDYRVNQRDYHLSTWEYCNIASDYLIPFHFNVTASDCTVYKIDTAGVETDIFAKFLTGSNKVTGWTKTGTGSWSSNQFNITAGTADAGDYQTSNTFTLTSGESYNVTLDNVSDYLPGSDFTFELEKGGTPIWTAADLDVWNGKYIFSVDTTGADYTFVITNAGAGTNNVTLNSIICNQTHIYRSGAYWWYDGSQLTSGNLSGILRFKVTAGSSSFYTDWCDVCGFTGLTKIKISSSFDYGGVKYVSGYAQWAYKKATVRRSPKAMIEIIGDTLNGERENEKITSAVKYTLRMKVTEAEWEALVHGMGATIEITDKDGKVYDAQNVELNDPAWANGNAVAELSFIDGNNVNVWTRNNSAL